MHVLKLYLDILVFWGNSLSDFIFHFNISKAYSLKQNSLHLMRFRYSYLFYPFLFLWSVFVIWWPLLNPIFVMHCRYKNSSWTIIFSIINIKVVWWCSKTIYQYSLMLNLESRPQHIIRSEIIWSLSKLLASNQNMFTAGKNGYIYLCWKEFKLTQWYRVNCVKKKLSMSLY